jgi:hypothetical protein
MEILELRPAFMPAHLRRSSYPHKLALSALRELRRTQQLDNLAVWHVSIWHPHAAHAWRYPEPG